MTTRDPRRGGDRPVPGTPRRRGSALPLPNRPATPGRPPAAGPVVSDSAADRVARLREQVARGEYRPPADVVLDRLLSWFDPTREATAA